MDRKRIFDLAVTLAGAVVWVTVLLICSVAVAVCAGFPIFYVSWRRVSSTSLRPVIKFRTMVRNADRVFNRDIVPVSGNVRFLNAPADSPLYTGIGRLIERWALTEIPQFLLVLKGDMSIVGNRPLPDNVIASLREIYPAVDDRFLTPAGMTGPVQLIGRVEVSDLERLRLEADYCRTALLSRSWRLDLDILVYTVLIAAGLIRARTLDEVYEILDKYSRSRAENHESR